MDTGMVTEEALLGSPKGVSQIYTKNRSKSPRQSARAPVVGNLVPGPKLLLLVTFFFQLPLGHFTASVGSSALPRAEIPSNSSCLLLCWGLGSVQGSSHDPSCGGRVNNRALGSNFKRPLPHPYFWSSCSSRTFQSHHLADCKAHRFLYFPIDSVVFECGNILIVYRFLRTNITQSPASLTPEASYCIDCVCAFHLEHASGFFLNHRT